MAIKSPYNNFGAKGSCHRPQAVVQTLQSCNPSYTECSRALIRWINRNGGFIHPTLALVDDAPCGARGVVATTAISEDDCSSPIVVVPENLYLASDAAQSMLRGLPGHQARGWGAWFNSALRQGHQLDKLSPALQLALMLAHERQKGEESFWESYIALLPDQPPNAWLMNDQDLVKHLEHLPLTTDQAQAWRGQVATAHNSMHQQAELAVAGYGKYLDVDEQQVMWAAGQVRAWCICGVFMSIYSCQCSTSGFLNAEYQR